MTADMTADGAIADFLATLLANGVATTRRAARDGSHAVWCVVAT
jgi:hypothetical protein